MLTLCFWTPFAKRRDFVYKQPAKKWLYTEVSLPGRNDPITKPPYSLQGLMRHQYIVISFNVDTFFVGNLPHDVREKDIERFFEKYGRVR